MQRALLTQGMKAMEPLAKEMLIIKAAIVTLGQEINAYRVTRDCINKANKSLTLHKGPEQ